MEGGKTEFQTNFANSKKRNSAADSGIPYGHAGTEWILKSGIPLGHAASGAIPYSAKSY